MKRRSFLNALFGLGATAAASALPNSTPSIDEKWGYVSIVKPPDRQNGKRIRSGDIVVYVNGRSDHGLLIKRAHDIEGWFEHEIIDEREGLTMRREEWVKADIRFEDRSNRPLLVS